MKQRAFDFFGDVALVKFSKEIKIRDRKKFAQNLINNNNSIKNILEKT